MLKVQAKYTSNRNVMGIKPSGIRVTAINTRAPAVSTAQGMRKVTIVPSSFART